jgi:hypothetical protein
MIGNAMSQKTVGSRSEKFAVVIFTLPHARKVLMDRCKVGLQATSGGEVGFAEVAAIGCWLLVWECLLVDWWLLGCRCRCGLGHERVLRCRQGTYRGGMVDCGRILRLQCSLNRRLRWIRGLRR